MDTSANITLKPYDESMLEEFVEIFMQGSSLKYDPSNSEHINFIRQNLTRKNSIMMSIRNTATQEFLGYCDVHNTDKSPWEIGIKLLERHWGKGVGYAALSEFIPSIARQYNQKEFIAKISPDNMASIRLFQKLGAVPRGVNRSMHLPDEEMVERFAASHIELIDDTIEEMARLFEVEPKYLLGRELVFSVPANPPRVETSNLTTGPNRKKASSKPNAIERFYAEELTKDLVAIKELLANGSESEEFTTAFEELKRKWEL